MIGCICSYSSRFGSGQTQFELTVHITIEAYWPQVTIIIQFVRSLLHCSLGLKKQLEVNNSNWMKQLKVFWFRAAGFLLLAW